MVEEISKELMDIMACPGCKSDLKLSDDKKELICSKCGAKYEIKDGIPVLVPQKKV